MKQDANANSWFFCNKPKPGAAMRLFCFPFSGGGASVYRTWSDAMSEEVEVCSVQLPGRESRYSEARETDIATLVENIVNAFESYQDKPFAFFGYSLGALLAFEVSRELRRKSMDTPSHLFVAAMRAPHTPSVHPPLSSLPDEEFLNKIDYYYQPQDEAWNNPDLRELFLPILKDDIALSDGYAYQDEKPLHCPIDVFAGEDDRGAPTALTQRWSEQTCNAMNYHVFKGGHFFINDSLGEIQSLVKNTLKNIIVTRSRTSDIDIIYFSLDLEC